MGRFKGELGGFGFAVVLPAVVTLAAAGCGGDERGPGQDAVAGAGAYGGYGAYGGTGGGGTGGVGGIGGDAGSGGTGGDAGIGGVGGTGGDGGIGGTGGDGGIGGTGGVAGIGGTGGVAGSAGTGGTGGSVAKRACLEKDSQVVVIGDSYINWVSHTMMTDLPEVTGQQWRNLSIGAASMASGGTSFIPDQFERAITEDPDIKALVMTGGGNDILVPSAAIPGGGDCKMREDSATLPQCQMIVQMAIDKALSLMDRAVEVGITDVIYFFYPEVPQPTLIGGWFPRSMLTYALPRVREACESAEVRTEGKLKCHFIDTIPIFRGHDDWFAPGDIHENSLGSRAITEEIWRVAQDNCIAQKAGNPCCE